MEVDQLDRLDKDKFIDEDKEEAARIRNERRQEEMLLVSGRSAVLINTVKICQYMYLT